MSANIKAIVEEINESFNTGQTEIFLNHCADNVQWTMLGKASLNGKQAIRDFMSSMGDLEAPKMTVHNVIADTDMAASNGEMWMTEADGKPYHGAFCDVYRFRDDKVATMHSYIVHLKS